MALQMDDKSFQTIMFHQELPLVWDILRAQRPTVLIVERFQPYGQQRIDPNGLATIEVVGSIYAIADEVGAELVIHEAIQRMPFLKDAEKLLPELTKAKIDSHQIDAMAHLLRYIRVGSKSNKYPPQLGLRNASRV